MKTKSRHIKPSDAGGLLDQNGNVVASYVPDFEDCVLPYCTWYQDDFLGAVRGMKAAEIGIYSVLLNEMYERGCAIDAPIDRLARLCGTTKKTLEKTLETLIEEGRILRLDCGLWNVRVQKIFVQREKNSASNSQAGKKSSKKRNKINGRSERALNAGSAMVQPIPESQSINIYDGGGDTRARPREAENPQGWKSLDRETLLTAIGADPVSGMISPNGRMIGGIVDMRIAGAWVDDLGLTQGEIVEVIRDVMARKSDGPPTTFKYFDKAMQRFAGLKKRPALTPIEGGQNERAIGNQNFNAGGSKPAVGASGADRAHQNLVAAFARAVSREQ